MTVDENQTFASFGLSQAMLDAIARKGWSAPSSIQAIALPRLLADEGHCIVKARTGTGKTAAFGIPLIERLHGAGQAPRALILAPTRELALQVAREIASLVAGNYPRVTAVYGGSSIRSQIMDLRRGTEIVVGTPGRVMDLMDRKALDVSAVDWFILDEADEMLDMGFFEDVEKILAAVNAAAAAAAASRAGAAEPGGASAAAKGAEPSDGADAGEGEGNGDAEGAETREAGEGSGADGGEGEAAEGAGKEGGNAAEGAAEEGRGKAPRPRREAPAPKRSLHIALFSATMPEPILRVIRRHIGDAEIIADSAPDDERPLVDQFCMLVKREDKLEAARRVIDSAAEFYGLIFCATKAETDELARRLVEAGYPAEAIHGDLSQDVRERTLRRFRLHRAVEGGDPAILVATDVAARGLDIEHLSHVINWDLPNDRETYVHRIGRTGRAGRRGVAISLATPADRRRVHMLSKMMEKNIGTGILFLKVPSVKAVMKALRRRISSAAVAALPGFNLAEASPAAAHPAQQGAAPGLSGAAPAQGGPAEIARLGGAAAHAGAAGADGASAAGITGDGDIGIDSDAGFADGGSAGADGASAAGITGDGNIGIDSDAGIVDDASASDNNGTDGASTANITSDIGIDSDASIADNAGASDNNGADGASAAGITGDGDIGIDSDAGIANGASAVGITGDASFAASAGGNTGSASAAASTGADSSAGVSAGAAAALPCEPPPPASPFLAKVCRNLIDRLGAERAVEALVTMSYGNLLDPARYGPITEFSEEDFADPGRLAGRGAGRGRDDRRRGRPRGRGDWDDFAAPRGRDFGRGRDRDRAHGGGAPHGAAPYGSAPAGGSFDGRAAPGSRPFAGGGFDGRARGSGAQGSAAHGGGAYGDRASGGRAAGRGAYGDRPGGGYAHEGRGADGREPGGRSGAGHEPLSRSGGSRPPMGRAFSEGRKPQAKGQAFGGERRAPGARRGPGRAPWEAGGMEDFIRVYVGQGRQHGAGAREIAAYLTRAGGVPSRMVDEIELKDFCSFATLPADAARKACAFSRREAAEPAIRPAKPDRQSEPW